MRFPETKDKHCSSRLNAKERDGGVSTCSICRKVERRGEKTMHAYTWSGVKEERWRRCARRGVSVRNETAIPGITKRTRWEKASQATVSETDSGRVRRRKQVTQLICVWSSASYETNTSRVPAFKRTFWQWLQLPLAMGGNLYQSGCMSVMIRDGSWGLVMLLCFKGQGATVWADLSCWTYSAGW